MLDRVASPDHAIINVPAQALTTPAGFARESLRKLGVELAHDPAELQCIPQAGRVIFVANHPHGALDGLITLALLGGLRRDLKVIASDDLHALQELAPILLATGPMDGQRTRRYEHVMRRAMRWLEHEGALLMFPAGEVSRFDMRARCVTDAPWSRGVALLARNMRAPVVPVHISGGHGLRPLLRRLLQPGVPCKRGSRVAVRVGAPLAYERLRNFNDEALTAHLRVTTYLLAGGVATRAEDPRAVLAPPHVHSLVPACAARDYRAEIARLPAGSQLHEQGDNIVCCAPAGVIPNVLDEIGRLREAHGRALGQGTGRTRDLDEFDAGYEHLFVWNRRSERITGACRLARVDELRHLNRHGLHSARLFRYRRPFFHLLGRAVEFGRCFVPANHDNPAASLTLMWKGMAPWLARAPRYTCLLGAVSIGGDYREQSRELLVEYLRSHCAEPLLGSLLRAAHPLPRALLARTVAAEVALLGHIDALAPLLEDIEADGKGVPLLLRQFLNLGSRVLSFNRDPRARGTIDCLLAVDLRGQPFESRSR
jgi:putative hemolysin